MDRIDFDVKMNDAIYFVFSYNEVCSCGEIVYELGDEAVNTYNNICKPDPLYEGFKVSSYWMNYVYSNTLFESLERKNLRVTLMLLFKEMCLSDKLYKEF